MTLNINIHLFARLKPII